MTGRLCKHIWKKGKLKSVNMLDHFVSTISHTASLSSRRWPANFSFCSVFVVSIHLLKSFFLILQWSSTLDFLLIVTCKSNKYKRRVQNMPFLKCGYLSNITRRRHKDRLRFMILTVSWLAQVKHERKGKVTQLIY